MDDWKYRIEVDNPDWPSMEDWCNANLGSFDVDWYKLGFDPSSYIATGKITTVWYFRDPRSAALFALRWV